MPTLSLHAVTKAFGPQQVLRGVDLDACTGGLTAVLGRSGCGKTTLLRLIAGFDTPDAGTIRLGERTVAGLRRPVPPERRGVGYVAQEGALFPHLTVAANITFGLPRRARRARSRVRELLELLGMDAAYAERYPHQLSGGQQQRVALARALAPEPGLVLLDEPFSALDAGLREETRAVLTEALAASGITAVLVTHDQAEALSVADRVALMREGRIVQTAGPGELYTNPADPAAADFVGQAVVLPAEVVGASADCVLGRVALRRHPDTEAGEPEHTGTANVMLRPEQILMHADGATDGVRARVQDCTYYGHDAIATLRLSASGVEVQSRCAGHELPQPGEHVGLTVLGDAVAYQANTPSANLVSVPT